MIEEKKLEMPAVPEQKSDDLKSLVEKNIKWSQVIYEQNKKVKHRLDLIIWGGVLKWLIILAPIILGVIYLPPLIKPLINQYSGLLGTGGGLGVQPNQLDKVLKDVSPTQIQDILKLIGK